MGRMRMTDTMFNLVDIELLREIHTITYVLYFFGT